MGAKPRGERNKEMMIGLGMQGEGRGREGAIERACGPVSEDVHLKTYIVVGGYVCLPGCH